MLKFGQVIEALLEGKCVRREGWNGKGMFVFKQVPGFIANSNIRKMQSIPDFAKKELKSNHAKPIYFDNRMVIVKPDRTIDSWVPSASDIFAEDWVIID